MVLPAGLFLNRSEVIDFSEITEVDTSNGISFNYIKTSSRSITLYPCYLKKNDYKELISIIEDKSNIKIKSTLEPKDLDLGIYKDYSIKWEIILFSILIISLLSLIFLHLQTEVENILIFCILFPKPLIYLIWRIYRKLDRIWWFKNQKYSMWDYEMEIIKTNLVHFFFISTLITIASNQGGINLGFELDESFSYISMSLVTVLLSFVYYFSHRLISGFYKYSEYFAGWILLLILIIVNSAFTGSYINQKLSSNREYYEERVILQRDKGERNTCFYLYLVTDFSKIKTKEICKTNYPEANEGEEALIRIREGFFGYDFVEEIIFQ